MSSEVVVAPVVEAPIQSETPLAIQIEEVVVSVQESAEAPKEIVEPIVKEQEVAAAPVVEEQSVKEEGEIVEEKEHASSSKKRKTVDVAEKPSSSKRKRLTRTVIDASVASRSMIETSLFTWDAWEADNEEYGDVTFHQCQLIVDVLSATGEIVLSKGQRITRADWIMSRSAVIFYPQSSVINAVVVPLSFNTPITSMTI